MAIRIKKNNRELYFSDNINNKKASQHIFNKNVEMGFPRTGFIHQSFYGNERVCHMLVQSTAVRVCELKYIPATIYLLKCENV